MCGSNMASPLDIDANSSSEFNSSIGSGSSFGSRTKKVSFDSLLLVKELEEPRIPLQPGMRIIADKVIEFDDESKIKLGSQGRVISVAERSVEVQMDDGSRFDADLDDISSIRGLHRGMRVQTRCSLAGLDKIEVPAGSVGRITKATCPNGIVEVVIDRVTKIITFTREEEEPCGILFTNSLQIIATEPGSAAEHSCLTSHKGWTVKKINDTPVDSNSDVINLCALSTTLQFEIERDSVVVAAEASDVVPLSTLKCGVAVKFVRKQKIAPKKYIEAGTLGTIKALEGGMYLIQLQSTGVVHEVEPVNIMPLPSNLQPSPPLENRSGKSGSFWSRIPLKVKGSLKSRFGLRKAPA
eukprot:TRINITY_DN1300_c0_g2_i1.p1 TRINITY_DN1300_c0_g2~~TRINITY_DN1300_c0_g2_i1.p1  ORF type:complete len:366 (+),score=80.98 TRINITY_DN1300_c0_g2_i1:38-1099(+)